MLGFRFKFEKEKFMKPHGGLWPKTLEFERLLKLLYIMHKVTNKLIVQAKIKNIDISE